MRKTEIAESAYESAVNALENDLLRAGFDATGSLRGLTDPDDPAAVVNWDLGRVQTEGRDVREGLAVELCKMLLALYAPGTAVVVLEGVVREMKAAQGKPVRVAPDAGKWNAAA